MNDGEKALLRKWHEELNRLQEDIEEARLEIAMLDVEIEVNQRLHRDTFIQQTMKRTTVDRFNRLMEDRDDLVLRIRTLKAIAGIES